MRLHVELHLFLLYQNACNYENVDKCNNVLFVGWTTQNGNHYLFKDSEIVNGKTTTEKFKS